MLRTLFCLTVFALLAGCSSQLPEQPSRGSANHSAYSQSLEKKLLAYHSEWKGTPYRYGGMSKRGVDCSGFVLLAYKSILGKQLPRTTEKQKDIGHKVSKKNLKTGDLVFFKTGWSTRHVGIYLSDSRFMHASTSQGVMISRLDNSYWKSKYWLSRGL
ncbi:NlpC/P60 family protein [Shewanella sp. UCD-KL12]|uniref:NlpC/P60 family protein n=1 Tax=Shewanella sp. UCD-KL12 TaxID=1917163 RepID=UPI0009704895|nr:NlpC/P60 family protein [Shewanella sp. UCD-KL12]